ncbi:MAG: hypothetical protein IT342_10100 [Candidatus Melainabacteria bacterium]|nr:hypothetical protein [Candidatus Melainabacteria bacterium]
MIEIDCLTNQCSIVQLPERQIARLYRLKSEILVLWCVHWSRYEKLTSREKFGITRLEIREDGSTAPVAEFPVPIEFSDQRKYHIADAIQFGEQIVFVVEEDGSEPIASWDKYIISFDAERNAWAKATSRSATGILEFTGITAAVSASPELSLTHALPKLFCDGGQLKCSLDSTPYHLDDWTQSDLSNDFKRLAVKPESNDERARRESRLRFSGGRRAIRQHFELRKGNPEKIMAYASQVREQAIALLNLRERLFQEVSSVSLQPPKPRYQRPQSIPWDQKEGYVSLDSLASLKPLPPVPVAVIPSVAEAGVLAVAATGLHVCALAIEVTKELSCVVTLALPSEVES